MRRLLFGSLIGLLLIFMVSCNDEAAKHRNVDLGQSSGRQWHIAYMRDDSGNSSIWMITFPRGEATQITRGFKSASDPSCSRDGQFLFFAAEDSGNKDIYKMELKSGEVTRLTFDSSTDLAPSPTPDGREITFLSTRGGQWRDVWIMNNDGSDQRRITFLKGHKSKPVMSPDGSKIAVQMDLPTKQIYLISPDGESITNISNNPYGDRYPTWSPDGTQLAFAAVRDLTSTNDEDGIRQIYTMSADGSSQQILTVDPIDSRHPNWSPDGSLIAFDRRISENEKQIFVIHPDGTGLTQVTDQGFSVKPAFCPIPD